MPPETFLTDQIPAVYEGEEITIWNRVTVSMAHNVRPGEIESHHRILAGDGSTGEPPEYVTPTVRDQLASIDVYFPPDSDAMVLDPRDEEVELL